MCKALTTESVTKQALTKKLCYSPTNLKIIDNLKIQRSLTFPQVLASISSFLSGICMYKLLRLITAGSLIHSTDIN